MKKRSPFDWTLFCGAAMLFTLFLNSCAEKPIHYSYMGWVESNESGLRKSKTIGNYKYSIQYKPWSYIARQNLRDALYTVEDLKEQIGQMNELQYFTLRIGLQSERGDILESGIADMMAYQERIGYLNAHLNQDIFLLDGGDTLSCVLHHFERDFGLTPYINITLAFQIHEDEKAAVLKQSPYRYSDKVFVFDDRVFGTGMVKLTILKEDLVEIPFKLSDIIEEA